LSPTAPHNNDVIVDRFTPLNLQIIPTSPESVPLPSNPLNGLTFLQFTTVRH
jgi:hypothetical protein